MTDEKKSESELKEAVEVEVLPAKKNPFLNPRHTYVVEIAEKVFSCASNGMSRGATAVACKISTGELRNFYNNDFLAGESRMQEIVAMAAMEQVKAGNPQMIMFVAKTRLGWNETNIVAHVGEVRSVVSNKPLTEAEFEARYLNPPEERESDEDEEA